MQGSLLGGLVDPAAVHDGPDPSDDTAVALAETHHEGDAEELLLVATGGRGVHSSPSCTHEVNQKAQQSSALAEGNHGFFALLAADVRGTWI